MRRRFVFYGYVQGVGFRWRAKNLASLNNVTGFVRNLCDGSVEMEAEGKEEDIDRLVMGLEQSRYIEIQNLEVRTIPEQGDRYFEIK